MTYRERYIDCLMQIGLVKEYNIPREVISKAFDILYEHQAAWTVIEEDLKGAMVDRYRRALVQFGQTINPDFIDPIRTLIDVIMQDPMYINIFPVMDMEFIPEPQEK